MEKAIHIETVCQCNEVLGEATLHPLVSIIDLSKTNSEQCLPLKLGFYSILLKEYTCECYAYGRKCCDYSDGTLIFSSPGETVDIEEYNQKQISKGWLLVFHPDLITGTSLGMHIQDYTFFTYHKTEALHISQREKKVFMRCLEIIGDELHRAIDRHSRILVSRSIELLLDYCIRFYDRQFITRNEENRNILKKVEQIVDGCFFAGQIQMKGLPTASHCAEQLKMSSSYFVDLLKHDTGKTFHEYVQFKRIEIAKNWLTKTDKSILQIANGLGFSSSRYFSLLFKRISGCTPGEYRQPN